MAPSDASINVKYCFQEFCIGEHPLLRKINDHENAKELPMQGRSPFKREGEN